MDRRFADQEPGPSESDEPLRAHTLWPEASPTARDVSAGSAQSPSPERAPALSIIAPVFDELDNLRPLLARVQQVFADAPAWELILVDDGSRDGSGELLAALSLEEPRLRPVWFVRNCGQTAALAAGIAHARAARVATLDADLQNDPADLPALLARLEDEGLDAVVGFRARRRDNFVRRASSRIANYVRNKVSGDSIRDTGCSLKVFRTEALRSIPLFEGMHRFLPTLLRYRGLRVVEMAVSHQPRVHGVSKYGVWNRAFRASRDLLAVRWMRSRMIRYELRSEVGTPEHSAAVTDRRGTPARS